MARDITVTSLDSLFLNASTPVVDLLKVDAEGHDAAVLRGAAGLLARARVGALIFEYGHGWVTSVDTARENLGSVVHDLDVRFGFDAYLVGRGGELLRLTGGCWVPDYETWSWSNVVAVHRRTRPALATRWRARSALAPTPPPHPRCGTRILVNDDTRLLAVGRQDGAGVWREAAAQFMREHTLESGDCVGECVVDALLRELVAACEIPEPVDAAAISAPGCPSPRDCGASNIAPATPLKQMPVRFVGGSGDADAGWRYIRFADDDDPDAVATYFCESVGVADEHCSREVSAGVRQRQDRARNVEVAYPSDNVATEVTRARVAQ